MIKLTLTIGTLLTGGAEVFVVNLIKHIDRRKFQVNLIVLDKKNNTYLEDVVESLGINVWYLNKPSGFSLKTYIKTFKILNKIKPNIIHGNIGGIIYVLLYVLLKRRIKVVHTIHTDASKEFGKLKRIILRYFYIRQRIIPVVLSNNNLKDFEEVYKIDRSLIYVINNGVDVNRFFCERKLDEKTLRLGHVGRFEEVKNHRLIEKVFKELISKGYNVSLRLVGKGSLLEDFREKLKGMKVDFVKETTKVENELKKIDIFIFPSLYEGMPLSLIEAMASGCVIIANNIGAIKEIIDDDVNGYRIIDNNAEAYVNIIEKLVKDIDKMKKISLNNIEKARLYSIDKMVKSYEELYLKELKDVKWSI